MSGSAGGEARRRSRGGAGRIARAVAGLCLALAGVAGAESESAPVELVATVLPVPNGGGRVVAFVAEFGVAGLEGEGGLTGEMRLRVLDAAGAEVRSVGEPFVVSGPGSDGQPLAGIKLFGEIALDPGTYTLEVTVLDGSQAPHGSGSARVRVTARDTGGWVASGPLVPDGRTGWRAFRANSLAGSGIPFPFTLPEGRVFLPRGVPELPAGSDVEIFLLVSAPGGELPNLAGQLRLGDETPLDVPLTIEGAAPSRIPGVVVARVRALLPAREGAGSLVVGFAGSSLADTSAVPGGAPVVLSSGGGEPVAAEAAGTGATIDEAALMAGYRRVLRSLADQGPEAAAVELAEFERRATASQPGRSLRALRDAEESVARQVAGDDAEAWQAILGLHVEADGAFVDAREPWLAAQGRRYVGQIVRVGRLARQPRTRGFAADALSLLVPADALELDPEHPLALLRMAIHEERSFRPALAVDLLRRLVKIHPDDAQAHLRLGVNLRRTGNRDAAERELRRAAAAGAPQWVREMAFGELGALARDRGQLDRAEQILREGIEQVGGEQLYLQLGFYLEQRNRSRDAVQLVNRMPVEEGQERPSARHLYVAAPEAELEVVRTRVRSVTEGARPRLAARLGGSGVGVGR